MTTPSELRLRCPAQSQYVAHVRHALAAFLRALEFERQALEDVTTAAGEALANIVEHAYGRGAKRAEQYLELTATMKGTGPLCVDVCDGGNFVMRGPTPNRGFGLQIIRAIAAEISVDTSSGTRVRMIFDIKK